MIATVADNLQGGSFAVGQECATGKEETGHGKPGRVGLGKAYMSVISTTEAVMARGPEAWSDIA
jgi:hypothetical protein